MAQAPLGQNKLKGRGQGYAGLPVCPPLARQKTGAERKMEEECERNGRKERRGKGRENG